ncbi:MAG: DUF1902 domain-containing protein [Nitrosospira sp.]|nr:DUF1902 domain-containing protein [Nitrosospira sp.]
MDKLTVNAFWDDEARVWVATSDDVRGLATEAETIDDLVAKLKIMLPELLDANGYPDNLSGDEVSFQLKTERSVVTHRHTY